ncbi:MAG: hypothetical protein RR523_14255 [Cetobacterium sp.]|uniref:hypothetical protein n=1 Tax=Cetobacterium sp. TaxID=2071632 RepID=UPI002FC94EAF
MEKETFFKYLELSLSNLNYSNELKFNIETELTRVINLYSEEQINEKIEELTYHPLKNTQSNIL